MLKVTFAVLKLCNAHNSKNIGNWKVHTARDLNFIVTGEGHVKVTGSHVHCKSGNISEIVLDRELVTTGH